MAEETAVRSIPQYPFKMSDTETVYGSKFATNTTTSESGVKAIITGKSAIRSFTLKLKEDAVYLFALDRIDVNGKTLRFVEPITANVAYQDSLYFCQNQDLGIISTSAKLEDCIKDFQEEILFIWKEYGEEDDNKLTDDAKNLKRKILSRIKQ